MRILIGTAMLCLLVPTASPAQENPLSAHAKFLHGGMKMILLQSAERMPEDSYSFRPTDAVRSYGQILGHVADMQYLYCSVLLGEKNPSPNIEKTRTSKADLISALNGAFAYCDKAYNEMTDVSGAEPVVFQGGKIPRLSLAGVTLMHSALHYGNLVTYMRMKNILPPTSDPAFMPQPKK